MAEVDTFSTIARQRRPTTAADVADEATGITAASTPSSSEKYKKIIYQDDDSLDQWCAIRVIKYRYRAEQIKNVDTVVCDIMLPMPLQLQTGYNQQWTELDDLSAILAQVAGGGSADNIRNEFAQGNMSNAMSNLTNNVMNNLGNRSNEMFKNLLLNPQAAGVLGGVVGSAIVGAGGGLLNALRRVGSNDDNNTVGQAAAGTGAVAAALAASASRALGTVGGLAANKYQTVTFEKPQLRQHQFSWNLVARSPEQAARIQEIIKKIKHHSSPNQPAGSFGYFEYPELFALHFDRAEGSTGAKGNENLFSISPSAMSSFNVDYHGAGRPLYSYTDKQPLSVTISMTLQEVVVVTKNTIKDFNR